MKCPFCGNEMKEGTLHSGGRYVQWKGVDAEGRKEEYLLAKLYGRCQNGGAPLCRM